MTSGSVVDSGYIPSQGYKVYRLTVNATNSYDIKTSYNSGGPNSDTYLELYNHDFTQIASNDDSDGTLYSRINTSLTQGDYYIIVRGYSYNAIQTTLNVTTNSSIGYEPISKGQTKYVSVAAGESKKYAYDSNGTLYSSLSYYMSAGQTYIEFKGYNNNAASGTLTVQ